MAEQDDEISPHIVVGDPVKTDRVITHSHKKPEEEVFPKSIFLAYEKEQGHQSNARYPTLPKWQEGHEKKNDRTCKP